jgi:carbon-monoxide dehydrogenase medium subunit
MKTLKSFEYLVPGTVEDAVSLLVKHKRGGSLIAGGTDLVSMMKDRVAIPRYLIDLKRIPGLDYIQDDGNGGVRIGALTTIATVKSSDLIRKVYSTIHEATEWFATTQVRNMATIGGNICRSAPSADMAPPLLVLDSVVKLVGPKGERSVLLQDFFTGPGENVLNNEILTEIAVPPQKEPFQTVFTKIARAATDLAKANCAVRLCARNGRCEDIGVALGAVAPTPIRAKSVEEALRGEVIDGRTLEEAVERVVDDIAPITDVRSNVEYRTYISKVLIKRLVGRLVKRRG